MSLVDQLSLKLKAKFPDAEIDVRKSDDPNGFQFLNLLLGDFEVAVEWKSESGFGISSFSEDSLPLDGMFGTPSEWCKTEDSAFHLVASLVCDHRITRLRPMKISDIRQERGMSQEEVSSELSIKQATYSKLERRDDVKVSSLRRVVEAMGGKLVIQAVFEDTRDVRELTFP